MPWPVIIRRGRVIVCDESQNHRAPVGRGSTFLVALPPTTKGHRCVDDVASKTRPLQGPTLGPMLLLLCCCCVHHQVSDHPAAAAPVVDGLVGA